MAATDHPLLLRCGKATFKIIYYVSNLIHKQFVEDRIKYISAHHITNRGVIKEALEDLETGKCAGLENIHAEHLNNGSNVLNVLLSTLCTAMMKHGYTVDPCCKQNIIRNSDYTGYQEQIRGCH